MKTRTFLLIGFLVIAELIRELVPMMRDEASWKQLSSRGDYMEYLAQWPKGSHAKEASYIYDERTWQEAKKARTPQAIKRYEAIPRCRHLTEAKALLASLATASAAPPAATPNSPPPVLQPVAEKKELFDFLDRKEIEIVTQGDGIERVTVRLRKTTPADIAVLIPSGTWFINASPESQNMIATAGTRVELRTGDWQWVSVPAAGANRRKKAPVSADAFLVERSSGLEELARVVSVIDKTNADFNTRQAAVWIATDDAGYDDLGALVSDPSSPADEGNRMIHQREAAQAMQICDEAGIDLTHKSIWKDRWKIYLQLSDNGLKNWLGNETLVIPPAFRRTD